MDFLTANDNPGAYPGSFYAEGIEPLADCGPLEGAHSCDVCVVGGGFTGVSTALHLAQRGYDVRLLEAQRIGFGASGRNGGQVGQGQRVDQDALEQMVGTQRARALWKIATQSVDLVRELSQNPLVRVDFHPGIAHTDHRPRYAFESQAYAEKLQSEYDYDHIRYLTREEMRELVKSDAYYGGTLDTQSGHIHPLEFALGLARMAQDAGAHLHEMSRVTDIRRGDTVRLVSDQGEVQAKYLVMACNGYLGDLMPEVGRHVMPINNFIAATEPLSPEAQRDILAENIAVADSKFVVNYFRFSDDGRMLFGGTESYGYRFPRDIAAKVRVPMVETFPQLRDARIDYAWGGTLAITMNRMPHFQRLAGNILSMSGFSGHGVAMGTLAGQMAAEAIAGQAERFDIMADVPTPRFPGGAMLRHPLLVLGMLWYGLRDRI
ncbi:MAG: NAD(P)/FAD-dependent oxidoreductase [Cognatishimia sp.]|uniref:NAD(P)/FAD-dependent oxidoreductase n=1 Tax=Cognatishimia sp. TaxID=2211648 RepID=UPI0040580F52